MSSTHTVPVIAIDGDPLTPTTPARAKKLVKARQAVGFFNKLGQYCIRMLIPTRKETPHTTLGVDPGAKYDGMAVVCGTENVLAVTLDLPDKAQIVRKIKDRATLRRARRFRNCRRRPQRFNNRRRAPRWIAPSQLALVQSRIKVLTALLDTYPISVVALEDVAFNHAKHHWGATFSTAEIGKARVRAFLEERGCIVVRFKGYETKELRLAYGYKKSRAKGARTFAAHCTDALTLACAMTKEKIALPPGSLLFVDDTYRPVRRRLHDTQCATGGVRAPYSQGHIRGLRKGLLIGTPRGKTGQFCGEYKGGYRFYDREGKRQSARNLSWISAQRPTSTGSCPPRRRTLHSPPP